MTREPVALDLGVGYVNYCGEARCPQCGKAFAYTGEWGWTCAGRKLCSYGCMRAEERRTAKHSPGNPPQPLTEAEKSEALGLWRQGLTPAEIRKAMGGRPMGYRNKLLLELIREAKEEEAARKKKEPAPRKRGGVRHHPLEGHSEEVRLLLLDGWHYWQIARKLGGSAASVEAFARSRKLRPQDAEEAGT